MVKTPSKRSASTAALDGTPVPERVVKLDPGLQSLMDHGDNIESFINIFAHLPGRLTGQLRDVIALNRKNHLLAEELSRLQVDFLEKCKAKLRKATRPEHVEGLIDRDELAVILKRRAEISKDLNNNVDLTKRMYEALDGCINRADDEINRLEADVKDSYGAIPDYASLIPPEVVPQANQGQDAAGSLTAGQNNTAAGAAGTGTVAGKTVGGARAAGGAAGVTQEAYSPNEPLYCICRQVGYGDMIGCDNDDCEHGEWFHYTCVGLEKVDISYWLCPGCSRDKEERDRREQAEKLRIAALMRATAAQAVKVAPVKLPSEGEDGDDEDDEDDDDDDDEEEEAEGTADTEPAAESAATPGASASAAAPPGNEDNNTVESADSDPAGGGTSVPVVEAGEESSSTGPAGGGARMPEMPPTPMVTGSGSGSWVVGDSIRQVAAGMATTEGINAVPTGLFGSGVTGENSAHAAAVIGAAAVSFGSGAAGASLAGNGNSNGNGNGSAGVPGATAGRIDANNEARVATTSSVGVLTSSSAANLPPPASMTVQDTLAGDGSNAHTAPSGAETTDI